MSAQIQYGSEMIEQLPLSNEPLQPMEYARIVPLLDEGYRLSRPLQHYFVAMILFVLLSFAFVDHLIVGYAPSLGRARIMVLLVKAVIFGMVLYMYDYFSTRLQRKS